MTWKTRNKKILVIQMVHLQDSSPKSHMQTHCHEEARLRFKGSQKK